MLKKSINFKFMSENSGDSFIMDSEDSDYSSSDEECNFTEEI